MKVRLVAVVALSGWLGLVQFASAQDTNTTRRAERRGANVQQRVDRMTTELNLNPDQQTKVKALLEKQAKERREIFADNTLPREERRDKMRALMEDENKQLKTILNSEQLEKYKKMREQMRERRPRGAGQPGSAAPAPAPAPAPEPKSSDKAQ